MRLTFIFLITLVILSGCESLRSSDILFSQELRKEREKVNQSSDISNSYTHISKTNQLRVGMSEQEVFDLLGMPSSRQSSYNGYMLIYDLYNPQYDSITIPYFVSTDESGKVTSFSGGGGGDGNSIDVNVHHY